MTFQNYRCWYPELVEKVMDTEALQISDAIFLATHHPAKMYRQDLREAESFIAYDEEKFLEDFLDDQKEFIFTAVLGGSGTGKSHLIRWLSVNIPKDEKKRVILIPKVGTNLREVIRLILQDMEGQQFDRYRERLEMATNSLSESEAREVLLNQLAVAVGPNGPHGSDALTDAESYLMEELPSLLYDPFFRSLLLKDAGFIDRLATHILGHNEQVERLEERREFSLKDLPIDIAGIGKASEKAREFYTYLVSEPSFQPETVAWLNKSLDAAIGQVLNFKGDDLFNLLIEVREVLAEQDIELVVLVEDFAKLQGIDHQLLEALLVKPNQPGRKRLCALRTALAVTTGYFGRLGDTVRQRINFRVNLDIASGENGGMVTNADLVNMVSRYLNVVRMRNTDLTEWFNKHTKREGLATPNACVQCPHIDVCQSAFGETNGISLYPFTETAVINMFTRVSPDKFNPRLLINDVLKLTLENYGDALAKGQFPPPGLMIRLGRLTMTANIKNQIESVDPVNHARRMVLLELWSKGDKLIDLHPYIHQAFNLPLLGVGQLNPEDKKGEKPDSRNDQNKDVEVKTKEVGHKTKEKASDIPESLQKRKEALDNWQNGNVLPQNLTQELREIIYHAVNNYIDWDAELLLAGFFRGTSAMPFRPTSVNFVNQSTQAKKTSITLLIPLDHQKTTEVAMALQGALLHEHFGNWNFPEGDTFLKIYARYLEQWSNHVLAQVRQTLTNKTEWDPVPATVELLAVGSAIAGLTPVGATSLVEQISALFTDVDVDLTNQSKSWTSLYEEFTKHRKGLIEILLSQTACTKGGSSQVKILDVSQLIEPLKSFAEMQRPVTPVPEGLRKEYDTIVKFRNQVDSLLNKAIEEETHHSVNWYKDVKEQLGDASCKDILDILRNTVSKAREEGAFPGSNAQELELTINRFKRQGVTKCLKDVEKILCMDDGKEILSALGNLKQGKMLETSNFISFANEFLDNCLSRVDKDIQNLRSSGGDDIVLIQQEIDTHLTKLTSLVQQVQGGRV